MSTTNYTGQDLRRIREGMGLTQTQMGERLGVTKTQVYRLEAGDSQITATMALLLAAVEAGADGAKRRRKI